MKKLVAASLITLSTLFTAAHAIDACEPRFKRLYKEIMIYNETEKISEGDGLIGSRLKIELNFLKNQKMDTNEKVHAIESGFARCDMELDATDEAEILMSKEALLKAKNPLQIDQ